MTARLSISSSCVDDGDRSRFDAAYFDCSSPEGQRSIAVTPLASAAEPGLTTSKMLASIDIDDVDVEPLFVTATLQDWLALAALIAGVSVAALLLLSAAP